MNMGSRCRILTGHRQKRWYTDWVWVGNTKVCRDLMRPDDADQIHMVGCVPGRQQHGILLTTRQFVGCTLTHLLRVYDFTTTCK